MRATLADTPTQKSTTMTRTNLAVILIASVAGATAGALTTMLFTPASVSPSVAAAGSGDARLAELAKGQAELQRALAELRSSQELLASRPERTGAGEPALSGKTADTSLAVATPAPAGSAAAEKTMTVAEALASLIDPNATYADRRDLWEKINKAGLLDAVVNATKERADREPNNPDLRVELGNAYLQEVFAATTLTKGKWAMLADSAFDAALELNPEHWEARFTKAVSLSNWPAFLGKQNLAITEFETLIKQQNAGPKKDEHAQTYLYLGNMYQASGSAAKALEAWQKGAELFPDNQALAAQLANAKQH